MRIPTWPNTGGRKWSHWPEFKVGIAWQGNPKNSVDRFRSLALTCFKSLAHVRGVHLMSLQVGPGTDQLAAVPFPVTDLGGRLDPGSLGDLAAVMANLDLVISVETAVAHLAGALAAPVWTLLPLVPDWRWLLERADSPWYPTMRLFRGNCLGEWDEVMERVQEALRIAGCRRRELEKRDRYRHGDDERIVGYGGTQPSKR